MGVKDLSQRIRPGLKSTNSSLQYIRKTYPEKDCIAVDSSILTVSHFRSTPSSQCRIHYQPPVPVKSVTDSYIKFSKTFINQGFKLFYVLDGHTDHPLKLEEYMRRHGNRGELEQELKDIYAMQGQDDFLLQDEDSIKRVHAIWKELAVIRDDVLYDVMNALQKEFPGNVYFVGAPFEADHQLAALYHQGIIDFVYTKDSDISALGVDIITNLGKDGKCWLADYNQLLRDKFPGAFKTKNDSDKPIKTWTDQLLHQCCCFLGNDYVGRAYGNGPGKVKAFIKDITDENGKLKDTDSISTVIRTKWLSLKEKKKRKRKMNEEEQMLHLSKWWNAIKMFSHGPAYVVCPKNNRSIREAITSADYYDIVLAPYREGDVENWNPTKWSDEVGLGWEPDDVMIEKLGGANMVNAQDFMKECFQMIRWRGGEALKELPLPNHGTPPGKSHHGSILKLGNPIPIDCHMTYDLKFWLACRQVSFVHCSDADIPKLVSKVYTTVGDALRPIQIEMMRGGEGYVTPQVLVPKNTEQAVSWKRGDEFLQLLKQINIQMDENDFTGIFGIRNGTRRRCLMHLESGSFDIQHLSATQDLKCVGMDHKTHVVFQALCSPSQRLKEKNKEKFYSIRVVVELNSEGRYCKFAASPYRYCDCPNGCIWCAHCGAYVLLLVSITKLVELNENNISYQDLLEKYPVPINDILRAPLLVKFVWPMKNEEMEEAHEEDSQTRSDGRENDLPEDPSDPTDIYEDIEEISREAIEGVPDASTSALVRVIKKVHEFTAKVNDGEKSDGSRRRTREQWESMLKAHVTHRQSDEYLSKQLVVLERVDKLLVQRRSKSTLAPTLEKTRSKREEMKQNLMAKKRNLFSKKKMDLKCCVPQPKQSSGTDSQNNENDDGEEKKVDLDVEIFNTYNAGSVQQEVLSSELPPERDIFDAILENNDE